MENKVIILGAGIGAMTMGFENAGCSVVAAYERDRRAIELYKKNISGEINELDQLGTSNLEDVPDIDILACDFYRDLSIVGRNPQNATDINNAIQFILDYRKPKIICFFIPRACLKWEKFVQLLGNINNRGYDYKYKQIYTEQATGLPITEKRVYLVAIHRSLGDVFEFPCFDEKKMFSLEEILENKPVEEFYRKVNCNCVNEISTKDTFFCWKQNKYIESDLADTNLIKIPLVRNEKVIRKITHRELARLKNLPDDYQLDTRNKAWMYRQLMYAPNTKIMEQIASEIGNTLKRNILQKSNMMREQTFAELFRRYLIAKCKNIVEEKLCDFKCNVDGKDICFELKIYNSDYAIEKNIKRACERLLRLKGDNLILVIGNVVSKEIKANCFEVYGIHIWDVKNLLWLFEEFSDIKNEFISLLTYSIDDLQLEIPEPQLFEEKQIEKRERTWEERLKNIQPGKEFFKEYALLPECGKLRLGIVLYIRHARAVINLLAVHKQRHKQLPHVVIIQRFGFIPLLRMIYGQRSRKVKLLALQRNKVRQRHAGGVAVKPVNLFVAGVGHLYNVFAQLYLGHKLAVHYFGGHFIYPAQCREIH